MYFPQKSDPDPPARKSREKVGRLKAARVVPLKFPFDPGKFMENSHLPKHKCIVHSVHDVMACTDNTQRASHALEELEDENTLFRSRFTRGRDYTVEDLKSRIASNLSYDKDKFGGHPNYPKDDWLHLRPEILACLINQNISCPYCALPITIRNCSLDRIDNTKCHSSDNVVICCSACNVARSDHFSFSEFVAICRLLRQLRKQESFNPPSDKPTSLAGLIELHKSVVGPVVQEVRYRKIKKHYHAVVAAMETELANRLAYSPSKALTDAKSMCTWTQFTDWIDEEVLDCLERRKAVIPGDLHFFDEALDSLLQELNRSDYSSSDTDNDF